MELYYVYEHWLFGNCIYVGSGDNNRPFDFLKSKYRKRNENWKKITKNVEHLIKVKIVFKVNTKKESIDLETFQTLYRYFQGHPLTNERIGNINKKGKYSKMYQRKFSEEQKENIRKAQIKYTSENGSQFKGKKHKDETKKILSEKSKNNSNASTKVEAINVDGRKIIFETFGEAREYFSKEIGRNLFLRIINQKEIKRDLKNGWKIRRIKPRKNAI